MWAGLQSEAVAETSTAGQGAQAQQIATFSQATGRTPPHQPTPLSAARQRKLHVGHLALMRAVVQGLDPRDSWERYFRIESQLGDQRTVRFTMAWIREKFAAVAKREDRFGSARLVRIDATRIAEPALDLPSLQAFAEANGLEGEREADQVAATRLSTVAPPSVCADAFA